MNKKIIITIFLLVTGFVRSQTPSSFLKTRDSLLLLQNDSVKLDALIKFCKEHGEYEFIAVMDLSKTVFKLADELKLYKRKAKLYNVIGDKLFIKANYQESFRYYYAGYKLADSIKSKYYRAMSAYNLGWQAAIQQKNYKDVVTSMSPLR
ncbi:MAG: hypothetical protein IPG08_02595 [Sphingobacteriaceae bacterium]|nr:hypothetical protein [Sphingobacteriaceae bacterium]